jgi:CRP-like cAMP-binding protein
VHTNLLHVISKMIRLYEGEPGIIQTLFREKNIAKGEFFLREGQICKEVGFINKGLVRYFSNLDGIEKIYDFGKENDFTCNYESFLDHSISTKNIQAIEDSQLLTISYANLQLLYEQVREGQKFGRIACEHIFVDAIRKITALYTLEPEQRYLQFLASFPDLQQRIPQYYISSFVGVKPPSLSRIRKRLSSS